MKATGVVRRIDELGRIVIPKEIRKNLRIHEGENIEIYIDDKENIVLKKYSIMKKLGDFAQNFTDSIYSFIKHTVFITDKDYVVAASGNLKKELLHVEISGEILEIMNKRDIVIEKTAKFLKFDDEKKVDCTSYICVPIVCHGDVAGMIVILSQSETINEIDEKIVQIAGQFLSKYLEE